MSNPYPPALQAVVPAPPLTDSAAGIMQALVTHADGERTRYLSRRDDNDRRIAELRAENESLDTVIAELDGTIHRYRQRLGIPVIDPSPGADAEQTAVHQVVWNGGDAPQTGQFAAVPGPPDNENTASCRCGDLMMHDPKQGWIHQLVDGWESAAMGCKRQPADVVVHPLAGAEVAAP